LADEAAKHLADEAAAGDSTEGFDFTDHSIDTEDDGTNEGDDDGLEGDGEEESHDHDGDGEEDHDAEDHVDGDENGDEDDYTPQYNACPEDDEDCDSADFEYPQDEGDAWHLFK